MKTINNEFIQKVNENLWKEASSKYGSNYSVPRDETQYIGEIIRGLYVLEVWQRDGQPRAPESFLRYYSVQESVISELLQRYLGKTSVSNVDELRPEKREKKWGIFIEWAKLHVAEQFTTEQLVEVCGFSYPTTLEYIKISPYFKKIKKGLYEVIDPKSQDK